MSLMSPSAGSRLGKRKTLDAAAQEFRAAQGTDRDEILAARRALRRAERTYDLAIDRAELDVAIARAPTPIAAHGRRLILYDDRLSTPKRTHQLVPSVRARVEEVPGHRSLLLVVEGPDWREEVTGHHRDQQTLRRLAEAIEQAAREVDALTAARRPGSEAAEGRLAAARVERLGIEEARPLLERIAALSENDERVLDMAPGISTGHDGVLVVTDRRLLFVGLRHTLRLPYDAIRDIAVRGRRFGTRLIVSTPSGRSIVSGIAPRHAAEIADLARRHISTTSGTR
jgi:Bacterial PH domain